MRFGRNLTASEILDQALHFRRREPVNHAVYMGMGEPFLNFDEVLASARRLPDLGITPSPDDDLDRRLDARAARASSTRSTQPIRLALSLHAADPRSAPSSCP